MNNTCCFIGHRKINENDELVKKLTETAEKLINEIGLDTFLFGSKSEFNSLCYRIITSLKIKYPHIKRVYVRSMYAYVEKNYENFLLGMYEETYFPAGMEGSGKSRYVQRNREMINKADFCIFYYDESYLPPKRKNGIPKSGTAVSYEYAVKKKKTVINLYEINN